MNTAKTLETQVVPYIFCRDVPASLAWLSHAPESAKEMRHPTSSDTQAQMTFGGQRIMVGQGSRERGMLSPSETRIATMGVFIYLAGVDAHYAQARAAGAEVAHPPDNKEWGRTNTVCDLDGHPWFSTTPSA